MLVILEAVAGPVSGRRIEIRAGTILRIGRTARADYPLGEDGYLSSLHFAVECDGAQCRIRDLGSSNGTFVNGDKVNEQVVKEGDTVTAGGSTFQIRFEQAAAPPPSLAATVTKTAPTPIMAGATMVGALPIAPPAPGSTAWPAFSRSQSNLLDSLYGPGLPVFAVLDAAKDSRIPAFLDASGEPYIPLDPTGRVPVYIAQLSPQSRLLDVLIKDGWGRGWCTFFMGATGIQEACAHLASYLTLYTVQGQPLTFRFWDPRLLRIVGPLMSAEEALAFFGPMARVVVEAEKSNSAVELALSSRGLRQQVLML